MTKSPEKPTMTPYEMKVIQANQDLETMAKQVAKFCKNNNFRGYLRASIAKSRNVENILVFNDFLDRATKQKNMPSELRRFNDFAKKANSRLKSSGLNELEGYNLYFPVESHLKKWKGEEDILVAYLRFDEKEGKEPIPAFSVLTGKKVMLNPQRPPSKPLLVLVPEEHETLDPKDHEYQEPPEAEKQDGPVLKPLDQKKNRDERSNKVEKSSSGRLSMGYLTIHRDGEHWTRGKPEVYLMYTFIRNGKSSCYYRDLSMVNDTKKRYWIRTYAEIPFYSNDSDQVFIGVWERDGSGAQCCACSSYDNNQRNNYIKLSGAPHGRYYLDCRYKNNRSDDPIHASHHSRLVINRYIYRNNRHQFTYASQWSDKRYAEGWFHWR